MIDEIFDAVMNVTDEILRFEKISEKKQQIKNMKERRCGNCYYWMKSTCRPEKELKQFKSISSFACKDFERDSITKDLIAKFEDELSVLDKR